MKNGFAVAAAAIIISVATVAGPAAGAPTEDRKPAFTFSMANRGPGRQAAGPLFHKAKEALAAAQRADGAEFSDHLAKGARLSLLARRQSGAKLEALPFTVATIRAANGSCLGPFSYDEGATWAQLSWVCRVDAEAPLGKVMTFSDSPELTATVWFEDGKIKGLEAKEPLPVPGRNLISMDAYNLMAPKR